MSTGELPRVALIETGGTVGAVGRSRLDLAEYTETQARLSRTDLIARVPEISSIAQVESVRLTDQPSYALSPADWFRLATEVQGFVDRGYDGVVVTHGTNTLEETAFALHLCMPLGSPIVVVGAMRPATALSSDGDLNLVRAIQVAASPACRDLGVLVVLNDTVHSARQVTKRATFRVNAFESPDAGPLGYADADGEVVIYQRPRPVESSVRFDREAFWVMPRVDIVLSYLGADGALIDAALRAGARGIVSAGTGAGRCTPAENAALDRAIADGVVVCQTTRVGAGRVIRSGEMRYRGLVTGDNLQPWKARILLSLALTQTDSTEVIQEMFDNV